MNETRKSHSPTSREWWTNKRILCFVLVLLATVYVLAQPALERWTGIDLPDLVERDASEKGPDANSDKKSREQSAGDRDTWQANRTSSGFELKEVGRDRFESPEGLLYTMGRNGEHRIDHVMRHVRNDMSRPVHGVFDAQSRDEVLALLDEAYKRVKAGDKSVRSTTGENELTEHLVEMPERIGYVGGVRGEEQGNPATKRLELILDKNRVITAYPSWPPRNRR